MYGIENNFMQDVMKEGNYENATYTKNWNVAKDICTMDQKNRISAIQIIMIYIEILKFLLIRCVITLPRIVLFHLIVHIFECAKCCQIWQRISK